ncbi:hypothetical protein SEA_MISCHIEF19_1 [Streptomyces phage Mischief19]|nr:hypothetical protein SEA_MISCHIEF19_1 [Streptomyces phage Mischief19]
MADNIAQETLDAVNLARAVRMRARGVPWSKVAKECEFPSVRAAFEAVGNAMAEATMRAEMTVDQYRDEATLRLEHLLGETLDMLDADAPETYDSEGNPMVADDRAVKLRAVDEARRLTEALAKLGGADKPKAAEDTDEPLTVRVIGINPADLV